MHSPSSSSRGKLSAVRLNLSRTGLPSSATMSVNLRVLHLCQRGFQLLSFHMREHHAQLTVETALMNDITQYVLTQYRKFERTRMTVCVKGLAVVLLSYASWH